MPMPQGGVYSMAQLGGQGRGRDRAVASATRCAAALELVRHDRRRRCDHRAGRRTRAARWSCRRWTSADAGRMAVVDRPDRRDDRVLAGEEPHRSRSRQRAERVHLERAAHPRRRRRGCLLRKGVSAGKPKPYEGHGLHRLQQRRRRRRAARSSRRRRDAVELARVLRSRRHRRHGRRRPRRTAAPCIAEPMDIPTVGRFAVLADPQGAVFAVIKSESR